jgi:hypothetical protein
MKLGNRLHVDRRTHTEPRLAAIPCLAGGLLLLAIVVMTLDVIARPAFRAIQRAPDLSAGIMMALIGALCGQPLARLSHHPYHHSAPTHL